MSAEAVDRAVEPSTDPAGIQSPAMGGVHSPLPSLHLPPAGEPGPVRTPGRAAAADGTGLPVGSSRRARPARRPVRERPRPPEPQLALPPPTPARSRNGGPLPAWPEQGSARIADAGPV